MEENTSKDKAMTDKEKADCFIELHKEQLGKFKQTRDIEWKLNLALWTLIIVAAYSLKKENAFTIKGSECIFIIAYILIIAVISFFHYRFWIKPIIVSENTDSYYINQYRNEVEKLTGIKIEKDTQYERKKQNWAVFEVGITVLLLVLSGIYLYV